MEQDIEKPLPVESGTSSLDQACFFQKLHECESWLQFCHTIWKALIFYLTHANFFDSGFWSKISVHVLWGFGVGVFGVGLFLSIQIVLFY